jgi:SPP1 family predicted phage head-tail adaptor
MTNFLSDIEIASMRAEIENTVLADTCNILTLTYTADGQGGFTEAWGTSLSGVSCHIRPMKGFEMLSGDGIQVFHRYILTLPYDTAISEANRVEIGGVAYNVMMPPDNGKSWNLDLRLEVERV